MKKEIPNLIREVCTAVCVLMEKQGLPDDDMLQCFAAVEALKVLGVPAETELFSAVLNENSSVAYVNFACIMVDEKTYDLEGTPSTQLKIAKARLKHMKTAYGLKGTGIEHLASNCTFEDVYEERASDFPERCAHLAQQAVAQVQVATPLSSLAKDPPGAIRSGPLTRFQYATRLAELRTSSDPAGLSTLLDVWCQSNDLDKPVNIPQKVACIASQFRVIQLRGLQASSFAWECLDLIKKAQTLGAKLDYERSGENMVHRAAHAGQYNTVKYLVESGVPIDIGAPYEELRCSALLSAISQEHLLVAEYLIEKGADLNARDGNGYTPLLVAAFRDNMEFVDTLLEKGANPHIERRDGGNMLHDICGSVLRSEEKKRMLARFLDLGLSPHHANDEGKLPHEYLSEREKELGPFLISEWQARRMDQSTAQAPSSTHRRTL